MKKILLFCVVMGLLILPLTGCRMGAPDVPGTPGASNPELTPTQFELLHHNFYLTSVNGQPYPTSAQSPRIEFNEGFRVSGQICNTFSGFGELTDNILVVKEMVSTKMFCADPNLNNLENLLTTLLQEGVTIQKQTTTLTLSRGSDVLGFTLRDWV